MQYFCVKVNTPRPQIIFTVVLFLYVNMTAYQLFSSDTLKFVVQINTVLIQYPNISAKIINHYANFWGQKAI
jgi:hypothetical protein